MGANWGEVRDWKPLEGQQHRLRDLFSSLPSSRTALESYSYYLCKIGSSTLPASIADLAAKLSTPNPATLLSEATVIYLEEILTRLIYGGNRQLRAQVDLRQSSVKLLDALVAAGSSVAYKLRDDFLTPAPSN